MLDLSTYLSTFREEEPEKEHTPMSEKEIRQLLGQRPKYYLKDQKGGWYLERKKITEDICATTWTHCRQEARAFANYVNAALCCNRLNLERQTTTLEVIETF